MKIIIGLGNPGKKYQLTRHNIGFLVADEFVKKNNFSDFYLSKKFNSLISSDALNKESIIIAKPQTFMNNSGQAVKILNTQYKIQGANLWVIHDDVDLPFGKIKIIIGRGAAGHKGVESIIKELKTKNFIRFRIGIKPEFGKPKNVEKFVLQKFNKKEEKFVKEVIKRTVEAIETALEKGIEKAMNKYNSLSVAL